MSKPFSKEESENIQRVNDGLTEDNQRLNQLVKEQELIIINLEKTIMDFANPNY